MKKTIILALLVLPLVSGATTASRILQHNNTVPIEPDSPFPCGEITIRDNLGHIVGCESVRDAAIKNGGSAQGLLGNVVVVDSQQVISALATTSPISFGSTDEATSSAATSSEATSTPPLSQAQLIASLQQQLVSLLQQLIALLSQKA